MHDDEVHLLDGRGLDGVDAQRCASTCATLERLIALPEAPSVTVVDNASTDGTADAAAAFAHVSVIRLPENLGAAGRNCGVARARSPYVAFSDDDSWWEPGALSAAVDIFDANDRLGVAAARVLVGQEGRLDPVCAAMDSGGSRAGASVLGFVACGSIVRRDAFLDVGGFRLGYGVGGEEELLAIDMAVAGWEARYCPALVAHHHPASRVAASRDERRRLQARNALWTAWLRRRPAGAFRRTVALARTAARDRAVRRGLADAARDVPWIWRERSAVGPALERRLRDLPG